jgi:hypothetical protein
MNALAGLEFSLPMAAPQVSRDIIPRKDCLGDVIEHHGLELYHQ